MRYLDKYPGCLGCPVQRYCGTMVGSIRLCNSYKDPEEKESRHSLTLSEAAPAKEEDYIQGQLEMWDNNTD